MHAIEGDLVKPDFLVDLLHGAFLFRHHLQLVLHLFQLLRVVDALRFAILLDLAMLLLFLRFDLPSLELALL